eukprot:TRINITY_DN808_c0_g1_i3.p1 TRINITY_DN808_c0_g1~~TRINITY_DN808_c0_g1_i3.p1  ORF type:complete len:605 (+),score=194.78 TRINITY_DN808_c0_g1_i3:925-2739(+)
MMLPSSSASSAQSSATAASSHLSNLVHGSLPAPQMRHSSRPVSDRQPVPSIATLTKKESASAPSSLHLHQLQRSLSSSTFVSTPSTHQHPYAAADGSCNGIVHSGLGEDFPFDYAAHPNPHSSTEETKLSLWYLERLRGNDSERIGNIQRAGRVYKNVRMQLQADDLLVPIKGRIELESFCGGKRVTGEGSSLWLQPHSSGPDGDVDDRLTVLDFQLSPERRVFSFYLRCNYSPTSRKKKRPEFRVSIYVGPCLVVDWKVSVFHSSSVTRVLKSLQHVPARCCLLYHDLLTSKWTRYTQSCDGLNLLPAYPSSWDHDDLLPHLSSSVPAPPSSSVSCLSLPACPSPPSSISSASSASASSPSHPSLSSSPSSQSFAFPPFHSNGNNPHLSSSFPGHQGSIYPQSYLPHHQHHYYQQQQQMAPPPTFVYNNHHHHHQSSQSLSPQSQRSSPIALPSISSSLFGGMSHHHSHPYHHHQGPSSGLSREYHFQPLLDAANGDEKTLPSFDTMLSAPPPLPPSQRGMRLPSLSPPPLSPSASANASLLTHMSNSRPRFSPPPPSSSSQTEQLSSPAVPTKKENDDSKSSNAFNCGLDALILCLAPYTEA